MTFTPLTNYAGFNHVPQAGAVWIHPGNGNAYCCACEKDAGKRQDLTVYRLVRGAAAWELVKRYEGTSGESVAQITMGGAAIDQDGNLLVVTSLILPNVPKVTFEGFQGVYAREPNIDEPWSTDSALEARIAALEARPVGTGTPGSGGMQLLPAPRTSPAWEGRTLNGGVEVDVPLTFGVPVAGAYLIRFVASAAKADVRVRAGTRDAPYFVTVCTQVAGLQVHTQGWAPGPLVWVSAVDSTGTASPARVWLQVLGAA